ncbi:hypothetical protein C8R45DRAFT_945835 [Mycena sanguinolenta]|nr:hypothetical protein C8R45DRAFT_945835 [Mycena sanguinolenta]
MRIVHVGSVCFSALARSGSWEVRPGRRGSRKEKAGPRIRIRIRSLLRVTMGREWNLDRGMDFESIQVGSDLRDERERGTNETIQGPHCEPVHIACLHKLRTWTICHLHDLPGLLKKKYEDGGGEGWVQWEAGETSDEVGQGKGMRCVWVEGKGREAEGARTRRLLLLLRSPAQMRVDRVPTAVTALFSVLALPLRTCSCTAMRSLLLIRVLLAIRGELPLRIAAGRRWVVEGCGGGRARGRP